MKPARAFALIMMMLLIMIIIMASSASCRSPTQITVEARPFDPLCAPGQPRLDIAITGGRSGISETAPPNAKGTGCPPTDAYYSLVYVPDSDKTSDVELRVVAAVGKDPETCDLAARDRDCIWQRRALSFIPHTPLVVVIDLTTVCFGVPCDPETTCDPRSGACVSKRSSIATCAEGGCGSSPRGGDDAATPNPNDAASDAKDDAHDAHDANDANDASSNPDGSTQTECLACNYTYSNATGCNVTKGANQVFVSGSCGLNPQSVNVVPGPNPCATPPAGHSITSIQCDPLGG